MNSQELPLVLLDLAAKWGAKPAEVYQVRSLSQPVFFEANRLKQIETTQSEGVALRLWRGGRPGLAVAYGPVSPQDLVERAIAMTELNEPEPIDLPPARATHYPNLGKSLPVERLVMMGNEAITQIREAFPEAICSGEWECEEETTRLVNSYGLDCHYTDTTLSCFVGAEWIRGDDFLCVYDGQTQRGMLSSEKVTHSILQRLNWARDKVSSPKGRLPVLLTAKVADLLWDTVQAALNGKRVLEKASPWSDCLNRDVTSRILTIAQYPDEGPYSCPFDDEGTPTQDLTLIQDGRLVQFYCDRATGRLLGTETTGNGFRPGLGSYPTPNLVNCMIQPGEHSLEEAIAQLGNGVIVDQIMGGVAGLSGDFSINVELGFQVEQGQITGRIKDTMVAGNVYTLLKQIVALGNDADWSGSCYTPSVIVEGMSVTAS